jgi:hypothetical protein
MRDLYCVICTRDIKASGKTFLEEKPQRAVAVVKGVSVCAQHISSVVKTVEITPP